MDYTDTNFNPSTLSVAELQELLTNNGISHSYKDIKSDLIELFKSELIPKLESDKVFDYYNKISNGIVSDDFNYDDDERDDDYDHEENFRIRNRVTCEKFHFKDLKPELVTKLITLFFQKFAPLMDKNPEIKSLEKQKFAKTFIFGPSIEESLEGIKLSSSSSSSSLKPLETYFMDEALKLINAKYPHFTTNKHAWASFGYIIRFFIVKVGPRFFSDTKEFIKKIDFIPDEDILYWDTVLLSHSRNFALAADKSNIKLGSDMVEYLICFTKSSSQHSECTRKKIQLFQGILEGQLDPNTFSYVKKILPLSSDPIWHLLLCLYDSNCSTIFTGNDLITKETVKHLSNLVSRMKGKECKIKLVNFKNGGLYANPIQHGARFMMNKLQEYDSREWKNQIKNSLPEINYMLEEADKYIKSHKNGETLTFPKGFFATFGETLKV